MKIYLGDSVYADVDGEYIVLTTENGGGPSNTIFLDAEVIASSLDYINNLRTGG